MSDGRRVLGVVPDTGATPVRDAAAEALSARARELLREEIAVGDPAAVQGACRFALRLGLISPAEAREIFLTSRHTDEGNPG